MWCFNLSELWWHISNKWFLGAAIHTGSNRMVSLHLNDWSLGFRLPAYTSEGSCQLSKCMKLYYAAHLENVCTIFSNLQIKRAVKLGERKQRELKRSDIFSYWEIRYSSPMQENQLPVPFLWVCVFWGGRVGGGSCMCAVWAETKTVTQHERVRLDCFTNQTKASGLAGSCEIWKHVALFLLERNWFSLISW